MSMRKPVAPSAARWITRTLEQAGHETWTVGGAVRDALAGRPSGDWDLATHANPAEVRRLFKRTVPIGVDHGTVGVLARDGTLYEVTTFRKDVETDGRHAVVEFAETIVDDLARRDFTINAIAWHALREEILDPFDGAGDLERGVVRTVGSADERFREDYLRILRALRFAGHFGFEVEASTWSSLCRLVDHLPSLSAERVREELLKILDAHRDPRAALELYAASGALEVLYPELEALREGRPGGDELEWGLIVGSVAGLPVGRPFLRLAALLRCLDAAAVAAVLMRLRLSNARVQEVARLAGADPLPGPEADDASFRRWLSVHGVGALVTAARLELARARAEHGLGVQDRSSDVVASWRRCRLVRRAAPPLNVEDLELDGRGLISLGFRPGPDFGRVLDDLLAWVLEDPARNERELLEARVRDLFAPAADG